MSGFGGAFGLSSLGSMSTLGSLAQSAQRLDRLMAGNRTASRQASSWNRNNSRRGLADDDFFGARSAGGSLRRRSVSPPRRFNRDDRRSDGRRARGNQRRGRDDLFGSSGAGILGAAPSLNDGPLSSGLGDVVGSSWSESGGAGGGGFNQLTSQTQQLLNMMQTQQLLAAVQAQAKLANQTPPSLMSSSPSYPRQGGRTMNQTSSQFRFGRNDRPRYGANRNRNDRKRKASPPRQPYKRDRKEASNAQASRKDLNEKKNAGQAKKDSKQEATRRDSGQGGEKQEVREDVSSESTSKVTKNAAGEDVETLVSSNYDGKRYWCSLCKIVCLKSKNIYKHFMSKRHVQATVEKRGEVFDPKIMLEEKKEPKPKHISELLKYVCNTKKTARKENNDVYISSLTECTVKITDFTTKQDFMGSEFVKAISGFKCQLCRAFMRNGCDVLKHIQGKKHQACYETYLKEHPRYLEDQREVNKNLVEILKKDEGNDVVLFEIKNDEPIDGVHKADEAENNCKLEESVDEDNGAEFTMDDYSPGDESKLEDEIVKTEEDIVNTEDDIVKEDLKNEVEDSLNDSKPVDEKEDLENAEDEGDKGDDEGDKGDDEEKLISEEKRKTGEDLQDNQNSDDHLVIADEEEEEFPLLQSSAKDVQLDADDEGKETKSGVRKEALPHTKLQSETPETPSEPVEEPDEEVEDVTPTRRNARKARRGRGAARATRGRGSRRTPRATKTTKKVEEVVLEEEVVEVEKKEDPPVVLETENASVPEEDQDKSEDVPEEQSHETGGELEEIDGFEVIDEIEGGGEDDEDEEDE